MQDVRARAGGGVAAPADALLPVLHEVTTQLHRSLDLPSTLRGVLEGVRRASVFDVAVVYLRDESGAYEVVAAVGDDGIDEMIGTRETPEGVANVLRASAGWGRLRFVEQAGRVEGVSWRAPDLPRVAIADPGAWQWDDALFAPLTTPTGEAVGLLSVDVPRDGRRPDRAQQQVLELFADHAAIAISHARLFARLQATQRELERAALHDPLTGVGNRTLLHQRAGALCAGGRGLHDGVGALVVDLDRFKAVNDAFGHQAGDEVLRAVADRLRASVREGDVIARTGGDEFVVVLGAPVDELGELLARLAARLHGAITAPVVGLTGTHRVGASIGTAWSAAPVLLDDLLRAADSRMYSTKRGGGRAQR